MTLTRVILLAFTLPIIGFSQAAPVSLVPTTATAKQVVLTWKAGDSSTTFIVQRRILGGSYSTVQSVTAATATDTTIDQFTTYQYQVIATAGASQSPASNEVTVGPPPPGFNLVVTAPNAFSSNANFGRTPRMVLDQNGDPAIIYLVVDPNGDNDYSDTQLFFIKWNRITYKWTAPQLLATTGDISQNSAVVNMSLARDPGTNLLGAAFSVVTGNTNKIVLATSSDSGVTWKSQTVITDQQHSLQSASLAMSGGQAYLGFYHDATGVQYLTGSSTADPTTWKVQKAPLPSGYTDYHQIVSVAVDSVGNPGLAMVVSNSKTDAEVFWRPGAASSTVAKVNGPYQNDDPDLQLAFAGTQPRLLFAGALDANYFADYDHLIWSIKSTDTGNTWAAAVNVKSDGNSFLQGPIWLDLGSAGQGAAVTTFNGGNSDGVLCGLPKVSRTNDFAAWTTCAPAPLAQPDVDASSSVVRFGANDKLWISFQSASQRDIAQGVVVWREPLAAGGGTPAISTGGVLNGASFTAGIAPGSLVTIFGSNFATTATAASDVPLPTNLGGVSVTVNGQNAPLFYAGVNQINFQMPYSVAAGTASVVVNANGVASASAPATITAVAPGIFVFGNARAVIQNQDFSVNEASNPAKVGSSVVLYATGQGALDNAIGSGSIAPNSPLSRPKQSVTVTIGGKAATVAFSGMTPGLVGVMQVNLTIPSMTAGSYPVVLTQGGVASNGPMITVAP